MKNGKWKGKDFFDVKRNPTVTFRSTRIEQTGPDSFSVDGDFTIRGVTRHEKLTPTVSDKGTGSGTIEGTMVFKRKEYGMKSGIPFIKIADSVEVSIILQGERISGPSLALKQWQTELHDYHDIYFDRNTTNFCAALNRLLEVTVVCLLLPQQPNASQIASTAVRFTSAAGESGWTIGSFGLLDVGI